MSPSPERPRILHLGSARMNILPSWRTVSLRAKLYLATSVLCLILAKSANSVIPILYGALTDRLTQLGSPATEAILLIVLAYSGLRIASFTLANFRDLLFLPVAQNISREWLRLVTARVFSASDPGTLTEARGVNSRLIDRGFKELEGFCRTMLFSVLPTGLEIAVQTVVISFVFDLALGIIPLFTSIAYTAVTIVLMRRRYPLLDDANRQDELMVGNLTESLHALEEIRVYRLASVRSRLLDGLVGAYHAARVRSDRILFTQFTLQGIILAVGYSLTVYLTTARVLMHTLSMGGFVAVNIYLLQLFVPLSMVGQVYHEAVSSSAALGRVKALLERLRGPPRSAVHPRAAPPIERPDIGVVGLDYRYETGQRALCDIDLEIPFGSRVGVLGRTGSGKSTLVRAICGLLTVPEGRVLIGGEPISQISPDVLHSAVVMVSQRPVVFQDTILENLRLSNTGLSLAEIQEAAQATGIDDWITQLPEGYGTPVEQGGSNLSGGQRQQICITRALLCRPQILILDEATSNLDRVTEELLLAAVLKPGRESTRIIISHRVNTLRNMDMLMLLDQGRLAAIGDHASLLRDSALYRELLGAAAEPLSPRRVPQTAAAPSWSDDPEPRPRLRG